METEVFEFGLSQLTIGNLCYYAFKEECHLYHTNLYTVKKKKKFKNWVDFVADICTDILIMNRFTWRHSALGR